MTLSAKELYEHKQFLLTLKGYKEFMASFIDTFIRNNNFKISVYLIKVFPEKDKSFVVLLENLKQRSTGAGALQSDLTRMSVGSIVETPGDVLPNISRELMGDDLFLGIADNYYAALAEAVKRYIYIISTTAETEAPQLLRYTVLTWLVYDYCFNIRKNFTAVEMQDLALFFEKPRDPITKGYFDGVKPSAKWLYADRVIEKVLKSDKDMINLASENPWKADTMRAFFQNVVDNANNPYVETPMGNYLDNKHTLKQTTNPDYVPPGDKDLHDRLKETIPKKEIPLDLTIRKLEDMPNVVPCAKRPEVRWVVGITNSGNDFNLTDDGIYVYGKLLPFISFEPIARFKEEDVYHVKGNRYFKVNRASNFVMAEVVPHYV